MKRVKTIIADDGETKATVNIEIVDNGRLTRDEVGVMAEILTSQIMAIMPNTRFLNVRLSQLVVK